MVNSIQSMQCNTTGLNKIGFAAKETAQTQIFPETPKDEFESHSIRNGAVVGAATGLIINGIGLIQNKGLSNLAANLSVPIRKEISKTQMGAALGVIFAGTTAIGAGIGAIIKECRKKD